MGKTIIFILVLFALNTVRAKGLCYAYFQPNSTIKLSHEEAQKIKWFYDSKPSHGYVSEGSHLRWLDKENRLKPEERIEIPYSGGRLVAFHKLRKGVVGQNFAAVAGVGVVNVKLIDARTTGQFEKYLNAKRKLIDFFQEQGFINSPIMYMDHFFSKEINKWVIVSWYNPGISFGQLGKFLKDKQLTEAQNKYDDFVTQVAQMVEKTDYAPISHNRLSYYLQKYAIYFDNQWSFNFF